MKSQSLLAILSLATTATSSADVLAQWLPTGGEPDTSFYNNSGQTPPPTVTGPGITVSAAARINQQVVGNAGPVWPGYTANDGGTPGTYDPETAGYTEFTITPLPDANVSFSTITCFLVSYGGMNDAGGYTGIVRTSADNFATELTTQTITDTSNATFSFDVASLGTVTEPVTFRLYFVNNLGTGTWADLGSESGGLAVNGSATARVETVTWTANTNDTWEIGGPAENWDSTDLFFQQGDHVRFTDEVSEFFSGTVSILGTPVPASLTVDNDILSYTLSGEIGGAGTLTKNGPGILTLEAPDNNMPFTGPIALNEGTLVLDGFSDALRNADTLTVASGATFRLDAWNGGQDSLPPIVLQGGTWQMDQSYVFMYPDSATVELAAGTTSTLGGMGNLLTFSKSISGSGNLIKDGTGSLLAQYRNLEYTGTTELNGGLIYLSAPCSAASSGWTINGGELRLGSDSAAPIENLLGAPDVTMTGGKFQVAGNTETIGALTMDSTMASPILAIDSSSAGLTVSSLNLTGTDNHVEFPSPVTTSGSYDILTAGTVNGTLGTQLKIPNLSPAAQVWSRNAGSGLVNVAVDLTAGTTLTWTDADMSPAGTWDLSGELDWAGASGDSAFLNADHVIFGDGPFTDPGMQVISVSQQVVPGSVTFTNSAGNEYHIGGSTIAGEGALAVTGGGTVTLAGVNTYTGGTTVSAGTLFAGTAGSLPAAGAGTTVSSGGKLGFMTGGLADADLAAIANNVTWSGGTLVFYVATGETQTFAGVLTGGAFAASGAGIQVQGGGTLDFTGASLPVTPTSEDGSTIITGPGGATTIGEVGIARMAGSVSGSKVVLTFTADGPVDIYASDDLSSWGSPILSNVASSPVEIDNVTDTKKFFVIVSAGTAYPAP
jgi:autotransporter-associated beta strand protein